MSNYPSLLPVGRLAVPIIEKPATSQAANQSPSPLMRLPAEIRVAILYELLVSDDTLAHRKPYGDPGFVPPEPGKKLRDAKGRFQRAHTVPESVQGYRLTPAILRVCQDLLREGWPILYNKNILAIHIHAGETVRADCSAPDNTCRCGVYAYVLEAQGLLGKSATSIANSDTAMFFSRFGTFRLDLYVADSDRRYRFLRHAVQNMAQILAHKKVQVSMTRIYHVTPDSTWVKSYINVFQLLRCKAFTFLEPNVFKTVSANVEQIATSGQPVVDLAAEMHLQSLTSVREALKTWYSKTYNQGGLSWLSNHEQHMRNCATDFDVKEFSRAKQKLLEVFETESNRLKIRASNESGTN